MGCTNHIEMGCTNNIEIERKFLVANNHYKELAVSHSLIRQGYLCANSALNSALNPSPNSALCAQNSALCTMHSALPTVRVRQYGDRFFLTIKGRPAEGHIGRLEWEREISQEDFDTLFPLAISGVIEKTRWLVPLDGGLTCEVDEFHGLNAGLVFAEVELPSEDTEIPYPDFLYFSSPGHPAHVVEVTSDARFYNSYLSSRPYSTWDK